MQNAKTTQAKKSNTVTTVKAGKPAKAKNNAKAKLANSATADKTNIVAQAVQAVTDNAKAKPEAKAEKKQIVRELHEITGSYNGLSPSFGRKRSRTAIAIGEFNTQPGIILTERGNAFMRDLKAKYGKAEFKRLDLDAGNLSRSIRAGLIQHVSGEPADSQTTFKLTQKALDTKY